PVSRNGGSNSRSACSTGDWRTVGSKHARTIVYTGAMAAHRIWRLCALPRSACEWKRLSSTCRSSLPRCPVRLTVAPTQALSRCRRLDLLDSIYVFADADLAVLLSGDGPLSFFAIGRRGHSHCVAVVQGNRTFAEVERHRCNGTRRGH